MLYEYYIMSLGKNVGAVNGVVFIKNDRRIL